MGEIFALLALWKMEDNKVLFRKMIQTIFWWRVGCPNGLRWWYPHEIRARYVRRRTLTDYDLLARTPQARPRQAMIMMEPMDETSKMARRGTNSSWKRSFPE